ncbi:hypothetical protein Bbelb_401710 [Branchiostoma belcheri]|nr:hypothetical protein Bbelb_401710 [Branchiostoma belcheri]
MAHLSVSRKQKSERIDGSKCRGVRFVTCSHPAYTASVAPPNAGPSLNRTVTSFTGVLLWMALDVHKANGNGRDFKALCISTQFVDSSGVEGPMSKIIQPA